MAARLGVAVIVIASAACSAIADLSATLAPMADTTLYQSGTGALGNGAGEAFFAGANSGMAVRRGLIRFDIAAAIPAGATITAVELVLTNSAANVSPQAVRLHRVLASWGEGASVAGSGGGGGAAALPGDATWLHRFAPGVIWTAAGGDFATDPSAQTIVAGPGVYSWLGSDLVADAQAFLDPPASNFGWMLLGNEAAANSAKRFSSREDPVEASRPRLIVTYIPTPGSAWCAIAVALAAHRRRRPPAPATTP